MKPWAFLLLLAVVAFAALATGFWLLFRLAYVVGLALVLSYAWGFANIYGVRLTRTTRTDRTQVGSTAEEAFILENLLAIPKLWIEVADQSSLVEHEASAVFTLGGRRRRSWTVRTVCRHRGLFRLGPVVLRSSDPFGLFLHNRLLPEARPLLVYPAVVELPGFDLPPGELSGESRLRRRTHQVTTNATGVREWQFGDSFNRIHWRSTARAGQLMVKEFELDPTSDLWIVLDLQREVQAGEEEESTEEYGVVAAASLAKRSLDLNRAVGLIGFGRRRELVHADRGGRQLAKILETLALVRAFGSTPVAAVLAAEATRFGRNCTVVVVTPSTDEDWTDALRDLGRRGVRTAAVMVEPTTFGGSGNPLMAVSSLALSGIPAYLYKQGESLDRALALPAGNGRRGR